MLGSTLRLSAQRQLFARCPLACQHLLLILTALPFCRSFAHFLHRSALGEVLLHGTPQLAQSYRLSFICGYMLASHRHGSEPSTDPGAAPPIATYSFEALGATLRALQTGQAFPLRLVKELSPA